MRRAEPDRSMTLTHQQAQELVQKSLQARLEGFERASLEAHLTACPACAAEAAAVRALDRRISTSLAERWPEPRYSAAEMQGRQASVRARLRRQHMVQNVSSFARLAGAAAVLLVLIAGLGWLALRGAPRPLLGGVVLDAPTPITAACEFPRHLVVEGETLLMIAARYGLTGEAILAQNRMTVDMLAVGQVLEIPTCGPITPAPVPTRPESPDFVMHSVDDGETCAGIAFLYDVSVESILQANGLNANCELSLGQVLRIPRPTPAPVTTPEGRIGLDEAERLVQAYIFASQPGMNPTATFPLEELTTDEIWQRVGAQVYKVREGVQQFQTYAIIAGRVYPIGESFGGLGVHTLLVTDLNADSAPELVYAYSFGSGIHQSAVGMLFPLDGGYLTTSVVDFRYLGELRLEKQDDQTLTVTGIPSDGAGEEALGRLVLIGTQLVIAPGDAALIEFTSEEAGIAFLHPLDWQASSGQFFALEPLAGIDTGGSISRACEWEANRADAPYGALPVLRMTTLGGQDACVIVPGEGAADTRWAIFHLDQGLDQGRVYRLRVDAGYAQVIGQSFRYLEPLATVTPAAMDMTPRAPGAGELQVQPLGSLTLSAYPVVSAAEDTPSHFEYMQRIPENVFPFRSTWLNTRMAESLAGANAVLEPFGYKLVERADGADSRIDLYWHDNILRDSLSMFYPPSVYRAENGPSGFAMLIEDKNFLAQLVQASPDGTMPLIENYDLFSSRYTRPIMAGERLISARRGGSADGPDRVEVLQNGEPIFTYTLAPAPVQEAVKTLEEWNGGWVLEVNGTLIVNGENWNQKNLRAQEIFNFTRIDGKPFFFFRRAGKIHAWYDGQELPMDWEAVIHYRCCEPAAFNVESSPGALWFHALRDGVWYYVEIKK